MRAIIYTALTAIICVLGRLRKRAGPPLTMRWDRTLPTDPEWQPGEMALQCCDCGLTHYLVMTHSATPERPKKYRYQLRGSSVGWTEPDPELGTQAREYWTGDVPLRIDMQA